MDIRRATAEDCPAIARILERSFAPYVSQYTREGYARTVLSASQLEGRLHEVTTLVAVMQEAIVGTVGMRRTKAGLFIQSMAVDPAAQGKGIARALIDHLQRWARSHGVRRMYLSTTPFLLPAIALYENAGFSIIPDSEHDLAGTPLIGMEKWIQK